MKCCTLQGLSKNVSHGVVALQGRPPSHAEEDHPILRLRGVLVNKRLQLKNSSIQVYTICEAKLALFIALPTVYRSTGSREARPQERQKTSPRSFKPWNRHAAADVGGGSISSALDCQHAIGLAIMACYFQFKANIVPKFHTEELKYRWVQNNQDYQPMSDYILKTVLQRHGYHNKKLKFIRNDNIE